jgi:hypothetical protein
MLLQTSNCIYIDSTTYLNLLLGHELVARAQLEEVESEFTWLTVIVALDHLDDGRQSHRLKEAACNQDVEERAVVSAPVVTLSEELRGICVEREGVHFLNESSDDGEHADALVTGSRNYIQAKTRSVHIEHNVRTTWRNLNNAIHKIRIRKVVRIVLTPCLISAS